MLILLALAGLLLLGFAMFSIVSDPGTATTLPKAFAPRLSSMPKLESSGKRVHENNGRINGNGSEREEWGDQELGVPLLGASEGMLTLNGDSGRVVDENRDIIHGLEPDNRSGLGFTDLQGEGMEEADKRRPPVVLRWTKLDYFVEAGGGGCGGHNMDEELAVLKGVSGFAGPTPSDLRRDLLSPATAIREVSDVTDGDRSEGGVLPRTGVVNGNGAPGSTITGILGPSGAGKSSLLDVLAGRKRSGEGRAKGSISLSAFDSDGLGEGGQEALAGLGTGGGAKAVRQASGYVSQEDVLPGTLTCYEHLMFHARLRMAKGACFEERRARVLRLVEDFGLRRVADSRIGDELQRGLSGGERRRLSIAAELVASPALLFLDEPTTGLGKQTAGGGRGEHAGGHAVGVLKGSCTDKPGTWGRGGRGTEWILKPRCRRR